MRATLNETAKKLLALMVGGVIVFCFFFTLLWLVMGEAGRGGLMVGKGKVGVVEIKEVIRESDSVVRILKRFGDREDIRAIVLRMDSPGGAVAPVQEIFEEVKRIAENKTVVASMGTICASGCYYVASGADMILANPGTITGSIGVIMVFPQARKLMEWARVRIKTVKSGKFKDVGSPWRDMAPEEEQMLKGVVENVHQQFIEAVAEGRKLAEGKVEQLADGSIMTGQQALEIGLVDELGGFEDAIQRAAELAGIEGKPEIVYPRKRSRWREILSLRRVLGELFEDSVRGYVGVYYLCPFSQIH